MVDDDDVDDDDRRSPSSAPSGLAPPPPGPPPRRLGPWEVEKQLGRGSFAVVWRARHVQTRRRVALKEIDVAKLNAKLRESLESEIAVLRRVRHENIIRLHDIVRANDPAEGGRAPSSSSSSSSAPMILVLEYCAGGDVAEYLRKVGRCREAVARRLVRQVAAGLRAMRERNLVHRDLKPQNLLLVGDPDPPRPAKPSSAREDASPSSASPGGSAVTLKIADFGFARYVHPAGMAETLCGSPLYMAPEILSYRKYDAKADLWSVGAILYELLVGRPPFSGQNPMQLLRVIERSGGAKIPGAVARTLSPECVALLGGLLRKDPVERMSFEEFFAHPFFDEPEEAGEAAAGAGRGFFSSREERAAGGAGVRIRDDATPREGKDDERRESRDAAGRPETRSDAEGGEASDGASSGGAGGGGERFSATAANAPPRLRSVAKGAGGPALVSACAARVRDAAKIAAAAGGAWLGSSPLARKTASLLGTSPGRGGGGEARGGRRREALPGTELLEGTDAEGTNSGYVLVDAGVGPERDEETPAKCGDETPAERGDEKPAEKSGANARAVAAATPSPFPPSSALAPPLSPATRAWVLRRAAAIMRDAAAEFWDRGRRADAVAASLTSLSALRRAVAVANARAAEAAARRRAADAAGDAPGAEAATRDVAAAEEDAARSRAGFEAARRRAERAAEALREDEKKRMSRTLLPDGAALAYEAALRFGRAGAAEELVGNAAAAADAYAAAETLLAFVRSEGAAFGRRAGEEDRLDERRAGERGGEGGGAGDAALAKLFAAVAARRDACRRAEE